MEADDVIFIEQNGEGPGVRLRRIGVSGDGEGRPLAEARDALMTPHQVTLVQDSFAKVRPIADTAADLFYGRLFEIAPSVRPMFAEDMREQKKKLMAMLGLAVANLDKPDTVVPALRKLGQQHVAFGTQATHYEPVGAALLWTLEQGLGPDFTLEVREAWTETYALVAGVMKAGALEVQA